MPRKSRKPFPQPNAILTEMLITCRQSAQLTQVQLSERLQIGQSAVSKVERGVLILNVVELHRWLEAIGVITLGEFAKTFDERLRSQIAAEARWRRSKLSEAAPGKRTKGRGKA